MGILDQQNMLCLFPDRGLEKMAASTSYFLEYGHNSVREPTSCCGEDNMEKN